MSYDFTEVLDISQPKISRHLAYLRNAGIVSARRDGKWMYYRIVEPEDVYAAQILQDTLDWLESQERMQKDYERLNAIYTAPANVSEIIAREPESEPNTLPEANMSYKPREELETFLL